MRWKRPCASAALGVAVDENVDVDELKDDDENEQDGVISVSVSTSGGGGCCCSWGGGVVTLLLLYSVVSFFTGHDELIVDSFYHKVLHVVPCGNT